MILKVIVGIILTPLVVVAFFLLYLSVSYYSPEEVENIPAFIHGNETGDSDHDTLRLLSWNIGYAGLSKQMDFFYEGGKMVRPSESVLAENLNYIGNYLLAHDSIDFMLLQEIDQKAKRSRYVNQLGFLLGVMPQRYGAFALNYNAAFVPVPLLEPMGSVKAGLATFSLLKPDSSFRYSLPASYSWPMKLFMLHRCILVQHFVLSDSKFLCLINVHNSAFDDASQMRKQEMEMIKQLVIKEYEKGNYVIAGGDWNINPPGFAGEFIDGDLAFFVENQIDTLFMPSGWTWAADLSIPTNRNVITPYVHGETKTSVLDFFLCSPNVKVVETKGIYQSFNHSDHNPVFLKVVLK